MDPIQNTKSMIDPKVDAWWKEVKERMEKVSENPPDPKLDPLEYQALLGGYKNAAEFKNDYLKRSAIAVAAGTASGVGLIAAGLALSTGAILAGAELPSLGLSSWNIARSMWSSGMTALASPKAQDLIEEGVECLSGYFDNLSFPTAARGQYWGFVSNAMEATNGMQ